MTISLRTQWAENSPTQKIRGKFVFKNLVANFNLSRGKPRIVELYHLDEDIDESENLIEAHPEIADRLSQKLRSVIARGTSRDGPDQSNDCEVIIDVTQQLRWAPSNSE